MVFWCKGLFIYIPYQYMADIIVDSTTTEERSPIIVGEDLNVWEDFLQKNTNPDGTLKSPAIEKTETQRASSTTSTQVSEISGEKMLERMRKDVDFKKPLSLGEVLYDFSEDIKEEREDSEWRGVVPRVKEEVELLFKNHSLADPKVLDLLNDNFGWKQLIDPLIKTKEGVSLGEALYEYMKLRENRLRDGREYLDRYEMVRIDTRNLEESYAAAARILRNVIDNINNK